MLLYFVLSCFFLIHNAFSSVEQKLDLVFENIQKYVISCVGNTLIQDIGIVHQSEIDDIASKVRLFLARPEIKSNLALLGSSSYISSLLFEYLKNTNNHLLAYCLTQIVPSLERSKMICFQDLSRTLNYLLHIDKQHNKKPTDIKLLRNQFIPDNKKSFGSLLDNLYAIDTELYAQWALVDPWHHDEIYALWSYAEGKKDS